MCRTTIKKGNKFEKYQKMEELKGKMKMKDWKRKIVELENRLNSFQDSTTERLETQSNKMVDLETLFPRVTYLESKIDKNNSTNQQVNIFINFLKLRY